MDAHALLEVFAIATTLVLALVGYRAAAALWFTELVAEANDRAAARR